jgi:UDP:flavonoid glycosyltransferase YjiC (YdhE family)
MRGGDPGPARGPAGPRQLRCPPTLRSRRRPKRVTAAGSPAPRALPRRVVAERYVPLTLLLPRCAAVVAHGGSGTVLAAVAHSLPLMVIPFGADQPLNAARAEALGLGRTVASAGLTAQAVRSAVREVLGQPSYCAAAERLREEYAGLPGPDGARRALEELARSHPVSPTASLSGHRRWRRSRSRTEVPQ